MLLGSLLLSYHVRCALCAAQVADFGLARSLERQEEASMTEYVATRWYRAPEILLGSEHYTYGVDMWSIGCILGELIGGKPMFPGTSTLNQIERCLEVTGRPSAADLAAIGPSAAATVDSIPVARPKPLTELYPQASPEALDLISRTLTFNPDRRLSAQEAIKHPYVAKFHDPANEPTLDAPVRIPIDDNTKFSIAEYRDKLYGEVVRKRREARSRRHGSSTRLAGAEKARATRAARAAKVAHGGASTGGTKAGDASSAGRVAPKK